MKFIKGYEGLYSITENGNVISYPRRWVPTKRLLKPWVGTNGYIYVTLVKNRIKSKHSIHSLVCEAFINEKKAGFEVNHIDGNKANNCLSNLEYVSRSDNLKHSYRVLGKKSPSYYLGRKGSNHNLSKPFSLKDSKGNVTHYESGGEFERITGLPQSSIAYCRRHGLQAHKFLKGKLMGFTVYF